MKSVFLAWQDPHENSWHLVGKLTYEKSQQLYQFAYTKGAQNSVYFSPFERMRDVKKKYFSTELFPLFANRLLNKSRPDYSNFLSWLHCDSTMSTDPLSLLARSGGMRATDLLRVFGWPEQATREGFYEVYFFSFFNQELRSSWINKKLPQLNSLTNQQLRVVSHDRPSLVLEQDGTVNLGEMPGYLAKVFQQMLDRLTITVANINSEAPWQLKVLCKLAVPEKEMEQLYKDEEEFQVLS